MKHLLKILIFCGMLFSIPLLTVTNEPQTYSYYENRMLAVFPTFSIQGVLNGDYFAQVESYINDHLAGRDRLLNLSVKKELALKNPVINNIVISDDLLLPYHGTVLDHYNDDAMQQELDTLSTLSDYCAQNDMAFLYVAVPEQSNAFLDRYPSYLQESSYADDSMRTDFIAALSALDIDHLEMAQYLSADYDKYYNKTDHHYNLSGAYETYLRVMEYINANYFTAPVTDDATLTPVDTTFLGSRNRKLLGLFPSDDIQYRFTLSQEVPFERLDNGEPVEASVYNDNYQNVYSYYMGGDIPETIIRTNRPELPDVLVVGDSFTNALETILYTSFDETRSLDFRYYTDKNIYEYLETYHPDVIVYVRDDLSYISTDGNGGFGLSE